jgi:hypothetical protein
MVSNSRLQLRRKTFRICREGLEVRADVDRAPLRNPNREPRQRVRKISNTRLHGTTHIAIVHLPKQTASCVSCPADHGLGAAASSHKCRQSERSGGGPMRGELWGLQPMAGGGVGGATCLKRRLAGREASSAPGPRAVQRVADSSGKRASVSPPSTGCGRPLLNGGA